jgi:hypothetical protein
LKQAKDSRNLYDKWSAAVALNGELEIEAFTSHGTEAPEFPNLSPGFFSGVWHQ